MIEISLKEVVPGDLVELGWHNPKNRLDEQFHVLVLVLSAVWFPSDNQVECHLLYDSAQVKLVKYLDWGNVRVHR